MKKILGLLFSLILVFTACTHKDKQENKDVEEKKLKVVTTIFPEYDLTRAIAKDKIDLSLLIRAGVDVHSFSPTPQDIKKIQDADVFIYGGTVHDKWVETLMKSVDFSNKKVIKLIDSVQQLEEEIVEGMKHEHPHSEEEHENHDEHSTVAEIEIDAHFWTSPTNAISMTKSIANVLMEVDKENASLYKENAQKLIDELEKLNVELEIVRKNAKRDKVVIADRFPFRYLFDDLKLEYRAFFSGCSVESQASSSQVKQMIDYVKENKIPVVYRIEMGNGELANVVAKDTKAIVRLLHSIHTVTPDEFEKGVTYIDLMKNNIEALKEGLN